MRIGDPRHPPTHRSRARGRPGRGAAALLVLALAPIACQPRQAPPPPAADEPPAAGRFERRPDALELALAAAFRDRRPRSGDVELIEILARPAAPPGSGFAVLARAFESPAAGDTGGARALIGVFEVDGELAQVRRVFDVFPEPDDSVAVRFEPRSAETLRVVTGSAAAEGVPLRREYLWPQ